MHVFALRWLYRVSLILSSGLIVLLVNEWFLLIQIPAHAGGVRRKPVKHLTHTSHLFTSSSVLFIQKLVSTTE